MGRPLPRDRDVLLLMVHELRSFLEHREPAVQAYRDLERDGMPYKASERRDWLARDGARLTKWNKCIDGVLRNPSHLTLSSEYVGEPFRDSQGRPDLDAFRDALDATESIGAACRMTLQPARRLLRDVLRALDDMAAPKATTGPPPSKVEPSPGDLAVPQLHGMAEAAQALAGLVARTQHGTAHEGVTREEIVWHDEDELADALGALVDALDALRAAAPAPSTGWPDRIRLSVLAIDDELRSVAERWGWQPLLGPPEDRVAWREARLAAWRDAADLPMREAAIALQEHTTDVLSIVPWVDDLADESRRLGFSAALCDDPEANWKATRRVWASTPRLGKPCPWKSEDGEPWVRLRRAAEIISEYVSRFAEPPGGDDGAEGRPARRKRHEGKAERCVGVYLGYLERKQPPPGPSEIAAKVGCSPGTASRAIKRWEDKRKELARDDARERYRDHA